MLGGAEGASSPESVIYQAVAMVMGGVVTACIARTCVTDAFSCSYCLIVCSARALMLADFDSILCTRQSPAPVLFAA
jgi:hypothetical protein